MVNVQPCQLFQPISCTTQKLYFVTIMKNEFWFIFKYLRFAGGIKKNYFIIRNT